MKLLRLNMTPAEYEQITCDIENSIEEFEELSREVDWFTTDMPDRLRTCLEIITKGQK